MTRLPLADGGGDLNFQIQGRETPPGTLSRRADWQVVTPGYFEAMGMRVVQGRGIEPADIAGAPGRRSSSTRAPRGCTGPTAMRSAPGSRSAAAPGPGW